MNWMLSLAFAVVAAAFALTAMSASRRCAQLNGEATRLAEALSSERGRIARLESECALLSESFSRLSGRVGQLKHVQKESDSLRQPSKTSEPDPKTDPLAWKQAMRAKLGLIPTPRN